MVLILVWVALLLPPSEVPSRAMLAVRADSPIFSKNGPMRILTYLFLDVAVSTPPL